MAFGCYIDPRGSEMPGPKLERMGVPAAELSLHGALAAQAETRGVSVDSFVQEVASKPQSFIIPYAEVAARCLRLGDKEQLEVADQLRANGLKDDSAVRQVIASLAVHAWSAVATTCAAASGFSMAAIPLAQTPRPELGNLGSII